MFYFFLSWLLSLYFQFLSFYLQQTHMYVCKYLHVQITLMQMFSPECKSVMRLKPSSKAGGVWHSVA